MLISPECSDWPDYTVWKQRKLLVIYEYCHRLYLRQKDTQGSMCSQLNYFTVVDNKKLVPECSFKPVDTLLGTKRNGPLIWILLFSEACIIFSVHLHLWKAFSWAYPLSQLTIHWPSNIHWIKHRELFYNNFHS